MERELEEKGITKESTISGGYLVLQNAATWQGPMAQSMGQGFHIHQTTQHAPKLQS